MKPTHLAYLHGFRSSPQSTKARKVAAWVARTRRGALVVPAAAGLAARGDGAGAARASTAGRVDAMAVIGCSLGGFYATCVAER